jgi:hypothetical protein
MFEESCDIIEDVELAVARLVPNIASRQVSGEVYQVKLQGINFQ